MHEDVLIQLNAGGAAGAAAFKKGAGVKAGAAVGGFGKKFGKVCNFINSSDYTCLTHMSLTQKGGFVKKFGGGESWR